MPLERIDRLMERARSGHYALGYFESWNLESLLGVVDAAEQTRSPIIIGFSGDFLSQRTGGREDDLVPYGALGKAVAEKASVPCGFIFNECPHDSWVERATEVGFNLVMPADPEAPLDDYQRRVKRLATLAHQRSVAVEADIEDDESDDQAYAELAARFVADTQVDLLAVSVGNEEIKLQGRAPLDLARLEAVRKKVTIPLVLHGGTGIDDASLKEAIRLGVHKINYGTYVKQQYLTVLRRALDSTEKNPHTLVGGSGKSDMFVVGRESVRDSVLERIELLGCCGRA